MGCVAEEWDWKGGAGVADAWLVFQQTCCRGKLGLMHLGPDLFSACRVPSVQKWPINGCIACVQESGSCSIVFSKFEKRLYAQIASCSCFTMWKVAYGSHQRSLKYSWWKKKCTKKPPQTQNHGVKFIFEG